MIEDEFQSQSDPSGSLDPPSRKPPIAVNTENSESSDNRRYSVVTVEATPNALGRFLSRAFDMIDEAADSIADALHIGPPRSGT